MFRRLISTRTTTVCHPAPLKTSTCRHLWRVGWIERVAGVTTGAPCRRFRSPAHNQGIFFKISSMEAHQPQPKRAVKPKGSTFFMSAVLWKWHANLLTCAGAVIDSGNTKNTIGSCQRPSLWITLTVWRAKSLRMCFPPVKG